MKTSSVIYVALMLILALTCPLLAQMDQSNQSASNLRATIQAGPVLFGRTASADVFIGDRLAMRIPASAAGLTPNQRAQIIADRLNNSFAAGSSWQDMRVVNVNGNYTVYVGNNLIATADAESACVMNTTPGNLAASWARSTVVALGGQPSMIASQIGPVQPRVAGAQQEIGTPPEETTPTPGTTGAGTETETETVPAEGPDIPGPAETAPVPETTREPEVTSVPGGTGAASTMAWTTSPTKSVPLINVAQGCQVGTVLVAGPQAQLDMTNAVAAYSSTSGGATALVFVPVTSAQIAAGSTVSRVLGVGVVGLPTSLLPTSMGAGTTGLGAGTMVMTDMMGQTFTQWNTMLNMAMADRTVELQTPNTKVVPLYSARNRAFIGSAQIVGTATGVANTQAVIMDDRRDVQHFTAVTTPGGTTPRISDARRDVVVSALVLPSGTGIAGTTGAAGATGTSQPATSGSAEPCPEPPSAGTTGAPPEVPPTAPQPNY